MLPNSFSDECYLFPIIKDDPLLYAYELNRSLDEPIDNATNRINTLESQLYRYQEYFKNKFEQTCEIENKNNSLGKDDTTKSRQKIHDEAYFESYSENYIHEIMLKDTVRTNAYRDFVYENKDIFKGKIVLDVGCGAGILSMFAARAGAKHVYAVDKSDIINKARVIVHNNGFENQITLIKSSVETLTLPVDKVDIIISEWMGYGLLYESMLDSVLYARDCFLEPKHGLMVPAKCSIWIAPIKNENLINMPINFWNNVYGFDMRAMKEDNKIECSCEIVDPDALTLPGYMVYDINLSTIFTKYLNFRLPFIFKGNANASLIHGFSIWFDVNFFRSHKSSINTLEFTTGPCGKATHWKQIICPIDDNPIELHKHYSFEGHLSYQKATSNLREIEIKIEGDLKSSNTNTTERHFEQAYILKINSFRVARFVELRILFHL